MYITICDTECPYKQENGTSVSHKMCVHSILANQATAATCFLMLHCHLAMTRHMQKSMRHLPALMPGTHCKTISIMFFIKNSRLRDVQQVTHIHIYIAMRLLAPDNTHAGSRDSHDYSFTSDCTMH